MFRPRLTTGVCRTGLQETCMLQWVQLPLCGPGGLMRLKMISPGCGVFVLVAYLLKVGVIKK